MIMLLSGIKIYNLKGSKKHDRFYVIDLNFAKVYRIGPPFHIYKPITWSNELGFRYGTPFGLWNDYVVIYINIYIFKGSNKYENGPFFHL